ncbi:MAG: pyruvate kinase [Clostridiales bacterium]|nr:pyruvate kinase [Clostridiales bacterium]
MGAKIIATLGPSLKDPQKLLGVLQAGADVLRINLSHTGPDEVAFWADRVEALLPDPLLRPPLLLDTAGPELRVEVEGEPELKPGERWAVVPEGRPGPGVLLLPGIPLGEWVEPGQAVLLHDGRIKGRVEAVEEGRVVFTVEEGGILTSGKKMVLPGVPLPLPLLTQRDWEGLETGLSAGAAFVALSFVQRGKDVEEVRRALSARGFHPWLIAKLESQVAVDHREEIWRAADGVMVARGDLGVEIPPEELPLLQKELVKEGLFHGKPVIIATEMLESMTTQNRPTRAEAADVANAILDGADAVMLSEETAVGKHPVEAVMTMKRIADRASQAVALQGKGGSGAGDVTAAVCRASVEAALQLRARAIVTPTESGYTARMVAAWRPPIPILAPTPHLETVRKLKLVWGVTPFLMPPAGSTDELLVRSMEAAVEKGLLSRGEQVIITAGWPPGSPGTTNLMKVHTV